MYVYSLRRTEFTAEVAPDLHCYWPLHLLCRTTSIAPPCAGEWVRSSAAVQSAGRPTWARSYSRYCTSPRVCSTPATSVCTPLQRCSALCCCCPLPPLPTTPSSLARNPGPAPWLPPPRTQTTACQPPRRSLFLGSAAVPRVWNISRPYDHRGNVGTTPLDKYPRQAARTRGSHSMVSSQPHPPAVSP